MVEPELVDDAFPIKKVASWFINHIHRDSGDIITLPMLHAFLYYAHAWYLANFDKPLFDERPEAWLDFVIFRTILKEYKDYPDDFPLEPEIYPKIPDSLHSLLVSVFDEYGQFSAPKLQEMIRSELPFISARNKLLNGLIQSESDFSYMNNLIIRNYYAAKNGKKEIMKLAYDG